jgi:hypothetical protein
MDDERGLTRNELIMMIGATVFWITVNSIMKSF